MSPPDVNSPRTGNLPFVRGTTDQNCPPWPGKIVATFIATVTFIFSVPKWRHKYLEEKLVF